MRFNKTLFLLAIMLLTASVAFGQKDKDKSLGAIKGKVRVETGTPADVTVVVRRGETEVTRSTTDKNGDFVVSRLQPGIYGLTFRKPGLSIGSLEDVEVKAGKTRSLGDRLILTIDEGSIAFLSGSVFTAEGRSVPNAKVELLRILEDGTAKKIDGRVTTETGSFKFRLSPDPGKYRVSVKTDGAEPVSKDVEIDGAAVYRVALSLPPKS
ncbi:MAG TPA: carboxypeptidase-like regulatory domain-containing protein [Pyrinomonadaceae bacterium]|nr:carboxypeptidase-like regulatory domain-containing protein [Pyrinomonadaceae bacterium]